MREEGALSLYRGLGPSLLLVSHGSLQCAPQPPCNRPAIPVTALQSACQSRPAPHPTLQPQVPSLQPDLPSLQPELPNLQP